jgi:EVE domain
MRFLLDTNILIPLEDSGLVLESNLANFRRLANENGHALLYHPASEDDIAEDRNEARRKQTLQRLRQYPCLDVRPKCPWNDAATRRNDSADNEILYALSLHAAHALVTEDRGIHDKARARGLLGRVYTIQTAEDLLLRLHESVSVRLPNIDDVPLYSVTPLLETPFFDSLRAGYQSFDDWFLQKAEEGRRAWVQWHASSELGGICIYARQDNERITDDLVIEGSGLKLATFKVGDTSRGRKVGELFLKAAFRYASTNRLQSIFIHGDVDQHHFLFEMLSDFGFEHVGFHPGSDGRDAVYLKRHPSQPPTADEAPFEYFCKFFPHFRTDPAVAKFVVPIRPAYHEILFPDFESRVDRQERLFQQENSAGNAIKMAYLSQAQTRSMAPGDIALFYRSGDERAITSIGVVESYETLEDADAIIAKVKRRTVYSYAEIQRMAASPTRVMLFRFVRHLRQPMTLEALLMNGILNGQPQSITRISHDKFQRFVELAG